jgi:hypothetical protein
MLHISSAQHNAKNLASGEDSNITSLNLNKKVMGFHVLLNLNPPLKHTHITKIPGRHKEEYVKRKNKIV